MGEEVRTGLSSGNGISVMEVTRLESNSMWWIKERKERESPSFKEYLKIQEGWSPPVTLSLPLQRGWTPAF